MAHWARSDIPLTDFPRPGRPRSLNQADLTQILGFTLNMHRRSTRLCRRLLGSRLSHNVSHQTIWREFKRKGYCPYHTWRKPRLTPTQIAARLRWCQEHRNTKWGSYVFEDETSYRTVPKINSKNDVVWMQKHRRSEPWDGPVFETKKYDTAHVKLALFLSSKRLQRSEFYTGSKVSADMIDFCKDTKLISETGRWVQGANPEDAILCWDNDPTHTSHRTKAFLDNSGLGLDPLPAISPDLNPVENVNSILGSRIEFSRVHSLEDLEREIDVAIASFTKEECRTLVLSMVHRVKTCIEQGGKITHY